MDAPLLTRQPETLQIDRLFAAIDHFLAASPYYPCLLLVHPDIVLLNRVGQQILEYYAWPSLSVGTAMSQELVPVAPKSRPQQAKLTWSRVIENYIPGPLLCLDIDLLFEPSLYLDPLHLLRDASRQTTLVVTWPGTFSSGILAYAMPAHTFHRSWTQTELCDYCIVAL